MYICIGDDLRYLFGEIMYGGHSTDDWDRRLCKTYLEEYMNQTMVRKNEGQLNNYKMLVCKIDIEV